MDTSLSSRINQLQEYLSSQYVDFDTNMTTERLNSLYSDFSKLKQLNPYGHEANVNYWRAVILDSSLHGHLGTKEDRCLIDRDEIPELFYRMNKGVPLSIDHVILDMIENTHDLLPLDEYEKKYPLPIRLSSLEWIYWIYMKPIQWFSPKRDHVYIVLPTITEYAKIICQQHYKKPLASSFDNLYTLDEFKQNYGVLHCFEERIVLSELDLWMILRYLHHEYGVDVVAERKSFTVIKFPDRNEVQRIKAKITSNDRAVIHLKMACVMLHRQVDDLQLKSEELLGVAKEYFVKKQKQQAAYTFKKKKKIDSILDARLKTLETMETILLKIEASQNDLQVIQAFNKGADALRVLLNEKEFGSIDKTMERVQDSLEDQKEVEEAMKIGNEEIMDSYLPTVDEQELEDELNSLNQVQLPKPIDTESELLRLQNVLSSLNHPAQQIVKNRTKELA